MFCTKLTIICFLAAARFWTSEGQLLNVACPGVNNVLQCPEGQVINKVLSMGHGEKSDVDCSDTTKPGKLSTENCLNVDMLGWAQSICSGLERCRLPKPNPQMFVCGTPQDDFVQITYDCKKRSAGERTVVACEGQDAEIKCENGAIKVKRANFGRFDENICTETPSIYTFCKSPTADALVKARCDGKKECKIPTFDLGPSFRCDDKPKYLTVDYVCVYTRYSFKSLVKSISGFL